LDDWIRNIAIHNLRSNNSAGPSPKIFRRTACKRLAMTSGVRPELLPDGFFGYVNCPEIDA
jgi:hypothetical protein